MKISSFLVHLCLTWVAITKGGFRVGRTGRASPLIFFQIQIFKTILYKGLKIYEFVIKGVFDMYDILNIYIKNNVF